MMSVTPSTRWDHTNPFLLFKLNWFRWTYGICLWYVSDLDLWSKCCQCSDLYRHMFFCLYANSYVTTTIYSCKMCKHLLVFLLKWSKTKHRAVTKWGPRIGLRILLHKNNLFHFKMDINKKCVIYRPHKYIKAPSRPLKN